MIPILSHPANSYPLGMWPIWGEGVLISDFFTKNYVSSILFLKEYNSGYIMNKNYVSEIETEVEF